MSKLVLTNLGKQKLLNDKLVVADPSYQVRLYKNNLIPLVTSVLIDFTESTFTGYVRKNLLPALWQAPVALGTRWITLYDLVPLSWTIGAGPDESCFGYFVVDLDTNTVAWAQRFDTTRILQAGGTFTLQPQFTEDTDTAP